MVKAQKHILILLLTFLSMFFVFTVKGADTVNAENLLNQVEEVIESESIETERIYEVNSYNAFFSVIYNMGGIVSIRETIIEPNTTQAHIDEIASMLELALSYLTYQSTYEEIINLYNEAISLNVEKFTPNSIDLYMSELNSIYQVIIEPTSGETIIQSLEFDIQEANLLLIEQVDKTELIEANSLAIKAYYEEKVNYTASSYELFKTAVDDYGNYLYVNSIIADSNISQGIVDELTNQILSSLNLLVLKIDGSQLLDIYYDLKNLNLSAYTPISVVNYNAELSRLYSLITGNNLDSELYSAVEEDLNNAEELLVSRADIASLQGLYNKVKSYKQSDYSASSYAYFSYVLNASFNMMKNENASQEEIDNLEIMLEDAIDKLRKPIKIVYLKIGETIDVDDYVVTGVTSIINYQSNDNDLVSVDNEGIIKGFKYGDTQVTVYFENGVSETLNVKIQAEITTTTFVLVFILPVIILITGYFVTFVKRQDIVMWFKNIRKK